MSQQPFVSIIMPNFNHGQYIGESIRSVLAQTYAHWELIVVDNYSTDDSCSVVSSFADSRIKLFQFNNGGVIAAARNHGVRQAAGDVLAFLDSDDSWFPDKLTQQLPHLLTDGISCVTSNYLPAGELVYTRRHLFFAPGEAYRDYSYDHVALGNPVMTSSCIVKTELFVAAGGFDESRDFCFIEDWELWLRLSSFGRIRVLENPLIAYRIVRKKGRDVSDVATRTLQIFDKHRKLGLIGGVLERAARGNCFVNIGRAYLEIGSRQGIAPYGRGILYARGLANKARAAIGFALLLMPVGLRKALISWLYRWQARTS